jgi:hypothetical protein
MCWDGNAIPTHIDVTTFSESGTGISTSSNKTRNSARDSISLQHPRYYSSNSYCAERSGWRWFPDGRIARYERKSKVPCGKICCRSFTNIPRNLPPIHSHREVEGRQDGNHAQRIRHWNKIMERTLTGESDLDFTNLPKSNDLVVQKQPPYRSSSSTTRHHNRTVS